MIRYAEAQNIERAIIAAVTAMGYAITTGVEGNKDGTASLNFRVMVTKPYAAEEGMDAEEIAFRRVAPAVGVDPDLYGTVILLRRVAFRLCGISPRRTKNCVNIERVTDKKRFVTDVVTVQNAPRR